MLGYVANPLARHSAERPHHALERALGDPDTRTVLIAGEVPVLRANGAGLTSLVPLSEARRAPALREQVLLGTLEGEPVLATLLEAADAERFTEASGHRLVDLRSLAVQAILPPDELGILAQGKALLHWHARHRFCSNCGAPTQLACAGYRRDCAACGAQHFPRTDPVAIMLVARGDRCLLGRQARFPAGTYSCLAGFVEPGETIEDAVRREIFEEAGVRVGAVTYQASQPWPFPSSLMIGCRGEALSEELAIDREELEDARWFSREEVRLMLARAHPDGLATPPPIAIAHTLMSRWAEED